MRSNEYVRARLPQRRQVIVAAAYFLGDWGTSDRTRRRLATGASAYPASVATGLHLFHITCGGCTAGWAGDDRVHWGRCHVTYDSITLYDAHRAGGSCVRPHVLGLVPTKHRSR
jgi:hypothetical protein